MFTHTKSHVAGTWSGDKHFRVYVEDACGRDSAKPGVHEADIGSFLSSSENNLREECIRWLHGAQISKPAEFFQLLFSVRSDCLCEAPPLQGSYQLVWQRISCIHTLQPLDIINLRIVKYLKLFFCFPHFHWTSRTFQPFPYTIYSRDRPSSPFNWIHGV